MKKMLNSVKITVKIDVPSYWIDHPDSEYEVIRKKIYKRWAISKFLTGKTAEEWLWNRKKHRDDAIQDGRISFLEAASAIEDALIEVFEKTPKI